MVIWHVIDTMITYGVTWCPLSTRCRPGPSAIAHETTSHQNFATQKPSPWPCDFPNQPRFSCVPTCLSISVTCFYWYQSLPFDTGTASLSMPSFVIGLPPSSRVASSNQVNHVAAGIWLSCSVNNPVILLTAIKYSVPHADRNQLTRRAESIVVILDRKDIWGGYSGGAEGTWNDWTTWNMHTSRQPLGGLPGAITMFSSPLPGRYGFHSKNGGRY